MTLSYLPLLSSVFNTNFFCTEQRAQLALSRSTSRATKIKKVPQTVREKMKERRKRKQVAHEARKKEKELKHCKTCRELKDCEVHRSHILEEVLPEKNSSASSPSSSPPREEKRVESPVVEREENTMREEESEDTGGEGESRKDVPPLVPDLKVPTSFGDLQENFQKLRNHFYRARNTAEITLSTYPSPPYF
jgi:hypothetical protein